MENYIFYYIFGILLLDFIIVMDANINDFSAFGWGLGCFFVPFLFVPLYFIYRTHVRTNNNSKLFEKVNNTNENSNKEVEKILEGFKN